MADMQAATRQAIDDGIELIEVDFPTAGLNSVAGDDEGQNEMTASLEYLRRFLVLFQLRDEAATTRIFFPDKQEMAVARDGLGANPGAGRQEDLEPQFAQTTFRLDFLTEPTGFMDLGLDLRKVKIADRVKDNDSGFVIAYPHFNVNEMIAVAEMYEAAIKGTGRPVIIFNGELDRLRSNYYPPFVYPKLAKVGKEFVPQVESAYYIHNFKGTKPASLFRQYPGPWKVYRRQQDGSQQLIYESDERPTLKQVALDILSKA